MNERGRISVNAAYQLLAQAAVLALNFVASPILVHGLGLEAYGLLVLVGITTNYFGFVELGLGRATVQLLIRHRASGQAEDFREVLWTATAAYLVLGLLGAGALVALAPLIVVRALAVSAPLVPQAIQAFGIGAAGLVIAMQRNVASSVATALERFDLISRVTIGVGALQAGLNIGLVLLGAPLTGVMLGGLAVQTVGFIVYFVISRRLVALFPPRWSTEKLRGLVRFGGFITISQVVAPVLEQVEKFLIGALAAVNQLPYYSVSYSAAWALTAVPTSLGSVIYPAMGRLLSNEDHAGVRATLRRSTRYIFVVLLGPVVLLLACASEILRSWMGADFALHATPCLRILSVAVLVNVVGWPCYHLIHATGRADLTARYHLLELAIHVPVSVALILRAGVVGAAVAWLLRVVLDTGLLVRAAARLAGISPGEMIAPLGRGTMVAVALLPLLLLGKALMGDAGRVQTLGLLAAFGSAYVLPVVWFGLGREERSTILEATRAILAGSRRGLSVEP